MKLLSFNNINFGYVKNIPIFKELNLHIEAKEGHVVALMGASGSGKSTLFKLILQNEKPQQGSISFGVDDPVIAYLPQEPVLFEHLTPMQNARYFQRSSYYRKHFNESLFAELISSLNIQEVLEKSKSVLELSGGQRQRLSLLRALSIQPNLLLLDEPTTGLDASVKLQFLNKLREIVLKHKLMVIYITHHKLETELIADEVIYLASSKNAPVKIYRNDLLNFSKQPPILEALEVFAYPKPNIIKGRMINNTIIPTDNISDNDTFYFGIKDDNVLFSDNGTEYYIIASNQINTTIVLAGSEQQLTIYTDKIKNSSNPCISFVGTFNTYNVKGEYTQTISI